MYALGGATGHPVIERMIREQLKGRAQWYWLGERSTQFPLSSFDWHSARKPKRWNHCRTLSTANFRRGNGFRLAAVFEGLYIDIREKESMGEDEGRVIGGTKGLALREDVYEGAWGGNGRGRFTACQEFGRCLLLRTVAVDRTRLALDQSVSVGNRPR